MLANRIATILGIGFIVVGVLGFIVPDILGMHLSVAHSVVHLVSGVLATFIGLKGSPSAAKTFCLVFGLVYMGLGVAGLFLGGVALPSEGMPGREDTRLWKLWPSVLEFGTMDHSIHILLGGIFLFGGGRTKVAARVAA